MADYLCKIQGLLGAVRPWSVGFHLTGPLNEAAMSTQFNAAAGTLVTTATNGLAAWWASDISTTNTEVITLNASQKLASKTVAALAHTGTNVGVSLPWDTTFVVQETSPVSDIRAARGHDFMPPPVEGALVSHVYTTAFLTSMTTVFDVFFPAIHANGMTSYSYNRRPLKDGTPPYTKHALGRYAVSDKPGTARRRTRKVIPTFTPGGAY